MRSTLWLTTLSVAALGLLWTPSGGIARADDPAPKPADKDKPPGEKPAEPAVPIDPSKPADPAKPADPVKPAEPAKPAEPEMAPDFTLKDLEGKERKLSEFKDKWVVLEWTNYGCPYVKKHYTPGAMQALQKKYVDKGVVWLSICSSGSGKEGYIATAEEWKKAATERKVAATAILPDVDGKVGHLYSARTTPDMRVIDPKGRLVYTGAIDDTKDAKSDPTKAKNYVAEVLDAGLAGKDVPFTSTKSYG